MSGRITPQITKLKSLSYLDLGENDLTGPVISGLRHLPNLSVLYLDNNQLSGPIPTRFVDSRSLRIFTVAGNQVCIPGTQHFIAWLDRVWGNDILPSQFCNAQDRVVLENLFKQTQGDNWTEQRGWLREDLALNHWHGIEIDELGHVVALDLEDNGLVGTIPHDLGQFDKLRSLNLSENPEISGRLPLSLQQLPLQEFRFNGTNLCIPIETRFQAWAQSIVDFSGTENTCDVLSQLEIMGVLYEATGGSKWESHANWFSNETLQDWEGVEIDDHGRIVAIDLSNNGLTGPLPLELMLLSSLQTLRLNENLLTGSIPIDLIGLQALEVLDLSANLLSGSLPTEVGYLKNLRELNLSTNSLTGTLPETIGELVNLSSLIINANQFSGPLPSSIVQLTKLTNLNLSENPLNSPLPSDIDRLESLEKLVATNAGLTGFIPSEIGSLRNLAVLSLDFNSMGGEIPSELGNLTALEHLGLAFNRLTGSIPTELGSLTKLKELILGSNQLTGAIPAELGFLRSLNRLDLEHNELEGSIPPWIGSLRNLTDLLLSNNELTNAIPVELGELEELENLRVSGNDLTGEIPSNLGKLKKLRELYLDDNQFSGHLHPDLGGLIALRDLVLSNNRFLTGPIPLELINLAQIEVLLTGGTNLCLISHNAISQWLYRIYKRRIKSCDADETLVALLTQPIQSQTYPVPLVAGRPALLRVFPLDSGMSLSRLPQVQANFFAEGNKIHEITSDAKELQQTTTVDIGDLASSINIEVPGSAIQPGLEVSIELSSDSDSNDDSIAFRRVPPTGNMHVEVHEIPPFNLTLIPFVWDQSNDDTIVNTVREMAEAPHEHPLLSETRTLLPVNQISVTAHQPVVTSSNNAIDLLLETLLIRALEQNTDYYMGMMSEVDGFIEGVAFLSHFVSFSLPVSDVIAHELGHNLSLLHAPCGGPASVDASYPYSLGETGNWGYDFQDGIRLVQPTRADLMSYCNRPWISDYHYSNALRYLSLQTQTETQVVAAAQPALLVWGTKSAQGQLTIKPSFVVRAPLQLPNSEGDYVIEGTDKRSEPLFSVSFGMQKIYDADGNSGFLYTIPVQPNWVGNLKSIKVHNKGDNSAMSVAPDGDMQIWRNRHNGQIQGILKGSNTATSGQRVRHSFSQPNRNLEVLTSQGVPSLDQVAW